MVSDPASDRINLRKEKRIPLQVQLQLKGSTSLGFTMDVAVFTVNVSKSGICFRTETDLPLRPGDTFEGTLTCSRFATPVYLEIKWQSGKRYGGYLGDSTEKWFVSF
ncbi:MAG: PilZ domain-containing protein [Acidobacteria bacterium]|nr:PilZ domain-containing protein [Acidobacteriota bacterium]